MFRKGAIVLRRELAIQPKDCTAALVSFDFDDVRHARIKSR